MRMAELSALLDELEETTKPEVMIKGLLEVVKLRKKWLNLLAQAGIIEI